MSKLVIESHNFENAKKQLKDFSAQTTTDLNLKTVDTSKDVGEWFGELLTGSGFGLDHKVSGKELNELTTQIQTHLHSIYSTHIKLIKEFGQVYGALEALDKDYIQAILISIKATEKTSEGIQATQEQVKKIVDDQKKTLEVLKKFMLKVDGYAHLGDIDKIWSDCQKWYMEISSLSNSISSATALTKANVQDVKNLKTAVKSTENKTDELSKLLKKQIAMNEDVIAFTSKLEKIVHMQNIDEMWDSLINAHDSLASISREFSSIKDTVSQQQASIDNLISFMEKLSNLEHLSDIDDIWHSNEAHANQLRELEKKNTEIECSIQKDKESTDDAIAGIIEKNDLTVQTLDQKIKYAYWFVGGTFGIAIIELIVILLKVI